MPNIEIVNACAIEWMQKIPNSTFDLIIADPPYNLGKNYGVTIDKLNKTAYLNFLTAWLKEASRILKPYGTIYVFMGFKFISYTYAILEEQCNLYFNSWICWHYTQGIGRTKGFSARHDDILMFTKHPTKYVFNLDNVRVPQKYYRARNNMRGANPGDVWEFSHIHYCKANRQQHPTQKPEGLIERMVLASSNLQDHVLDPFAGSGTTLRVCQQLNRNCTGVEINPAYITMINTRLNQPFNGFDSVDPRMKRIPLDLRDIKLKETYIKNHKKWFLTNHEANLQEFEQQLSNH